MKRLIVITVIAKNKTMEVWIDGVFKFKDEFKYGEHAVQAGHAYAEQFSHHDPVLRIDLSGA